MKMTLSNQLPEYPAFVEGIRRAPDRGYTLSPAQTATALKNALRYIPVDLHEKLAPEFLEELRTRGRIYGYRFRPAGDLKAKPIDEYRGSVRHEILRSDWSVCRQKLLLWPVLPSIHPESVSCRHIF